MGRKQSRRDGFDGPVGDQDGSSAGIEKGAPQAGDGVSPQSLTDAGVRAVSVLFEPRENVPVDLGTLKVVVQKMFDIDITERVTPYASPQGISIDDAKVPSGEHLIEISVADVQGRRTTQLVKLSIARP